MKDYMKVIGSTAVVAALAGAPFVALAVENGSDAMAQVEVQADVVVPIKAQVSAREQVRERAEEIAQQTREEGRMEVSATSSEEDEDAVESTVERMMERQKKMFELREREDVSMARSFEDLKKRIEMRKQELEEELASSTEREHGVIANANPVRLAVHTLLASKDLLGGIGSQVSEIAKHMNDSVASTTEAEGKIQSRGFFKRFLFGGDKAAAKAIDNAVEQNQQRIDELTVLMSQADISADLKAALEVQIAALKDAQTRLQDVAQKEQRTWGIFSWRF